MATSFPGGLDSFTNPTGSDGLATEIGTRTHSEMHADINDAMEAVQTALGTNLSAVILDTLVDAKGDLITATAADTPARLAAGTNGYTLTAQSGESTGLKWVAQPGLVINTVSAAGTTETLDGDDYNIHDVTLDENVTFTFTTTATVAQFTLILRQDGSGTNTTTWPSSVKWNALTAPTLTTGASDVAVLEFLTVDGGTVWRGFLASQATT